MTNKYYNKEWAAEYYIKNKEVIKARNKVWRNKNPEKMKLLIAKYKSADNPSYQVYAKNNFVRHLISRVKRMSKVRNIDFNLEECDINIPVKCPLLDIELTTIYGGGIVPTNASIDRIDSTKGYIKGNIQMISLLANRMKNNATQEQLLNFAKGIIKQANQKDKREILSWALDEIQQTLGK